MVDVDDFCEFLEEKYPSSIIRQFSDGAVTLAIGKSDVDSEIVLKPEELPGHWSLEKVFYGPGGIEFQLENSGPRLHTNCEKPR